MKINNHSQFNIIYAKIENWQTKKLNIFRKDILIWNNNCNQALKISLYKIFYKFFKLATDPADWSKISPKALEKISRNLLHAAIYINYIEMF